LHNVSLSQYFAAGIGRQASVTISLCGASHYRQIQTNLAAEVPAIILNSSHRLDIPRMRHRVRIKNSMRTNGVHLSIYTCLAKRDTDSYVNSQSYPYRTAGEAFDTSFNVIQGACDDAFVGVTPYDAPPFFEYYKILKVRRKYLPQGRSLTLKHSFKNSSIPFTWFSDNDAVNIAKHTIQYLIIYHGEMDKLFGSANMTTGPAAITVWHTAHTKLRNSGDWLSDVMSCQLINNLTTVTAPDVVLENSLQAQALQAIMT